MDKKVKGAKIGTFLHSKPRNMKTQISLLFVAFFSLLIDKAYTQEVFAVDDSLCIELGEDLMFNVKANDELSPNFDGIVFLTSPSNCFELTQDGRLFLAQGNMDCCGDHVLKYQYEPCLGGGGCSANIFITVKCPKPECFVVNLEDYLDPTNPDGENRHDCVSACENSNATYFVNYNPLNTYNWSVAGGTFSPGANPAEIQVTWGTMGSGSISLTIIKPNNERQIIEICVDILEAPVADFVPSTTGACLDGSVFFMNNSIGGNDYFWDFGDGNTSTMYEPTHQFATPGTYTVTLFVTRDNFDQQGNPLCCCTDSTSVDITVDPLSGPEIFCISTLCAYESTKYWTNASNCGTYDWTVLDATGTPIPFIGQGNDTICVQWGDGPFGVVQLEVSGCDSAYCDEPSTEIVPIISPFATIDGLTEVCENATTTYTVPKWLSVYYNWQVVGGSIISGQGTHSVTIQWGLAPGPGIINLTYSSEFLGGLPGQDPLNCEGTANLSVDINPEFELFGPNPPVVCVDATSSFFATAFPSSSYTWTTSPPVSFTGQGTNNIVVTWDAGPGTFEVTAIPDDPSAYCNEEETLVITVVELLPPDGIDGPTEICPGETNLYFAQSSTSGVGFIWNITGGTPSFFNGDPVSVTWNATGPYSISLEQYLLNAPFCTSPLIQINPIAKEINSPLAITGPGGCINSVQSYSGSPTQHPDATHEWSITPPEAGSVIAGQGTPNIQVQWNNDAVTANLIYQVALCGDTLAISLAIPLNAPLVPNITQTGVLCPGVSATLDAGPGSDFIDWNWSTGSTSQTTVITTGGTYTVTTTDVNGCEAVTSFQAQALSGPVADISTPDFRTICIDPPNSNTVTIYAQSNPNYSYTWTCLRDGIPQPNTNTSPIFVHTNDNTIATFNYWVQVTDQNGCTDISNTITVNQTDICRDTCNAQAYQLVVTPFQQTPDCDVINFIPFNSPNVTLTGWDFGDPANNTNTGTISNAIHKYSKAGYFLATVMGTVPSIPPGGGGTCQVSETVSVCIPLAADFDFVDSCETVTFNDLSTFLPGQDITSWFWDFGDGNTSTQQHPSHTYTTPPNSYTVTLTVSNAAGCQVTITKTITITGAPSPAISATPNPVCVGEPVSFTGSGSGVISWLWDFDDGASNGGQNPSHTYLSPGTYNVTLTVTSADGCEGTATQAITVNPAPAADTIAYSPGLVICEGDVVTLSGPSVAGYTYLWTTNATTPTIQVTSSGEYGLIITDANGCTLKLDPVTVTVIPKPEATISGSSFICDGGCIILSAPTGAGYTYKWFDGSNVQIPFALGSNLNVCDFNLLSPYTVEVTDANGCVDLSDPFDVALVSSPSFSVSVSPDGCEGTLNTLTVNPVQTDVVYTWNNGAIGPVISVLQAGQYTVVGTDTLTGCTGTASATINPLPDLCLVPVGCYEVCNPDTICGPAGLAAYQWNENGVPIPGAVNQCLIVNKSGTYSLTGTTLFGCSQTSDSLMLEVIECDSLDCDDLAISLSPLNSAEEDCCWKVSYTNDYAGDLLGLMIHSGDTDFNFDLGSLDPSLSVHTIGGHWLGLVNSTPNAPIPTGVLQDFLEFCLTDIQNSPQQIIFDWYDFDNNIVCSDTLELNCPVEPDCLYMAKDSIYCEGSQVVYEVEVCNPLDNSFSIGFIKFLPTSPAGIVVTPSSIDISSNPMVPGECRKFVLLLSGANIANQQFCYTLAAHEFDPEESPLALCCSLEQTYCKEIPDCDPCDDIGVEGVDRAEAECCYNIYLYNNFGPGVFDGIGLCMLTPNTTMTIDNPFGSGWQTTAYSSTNIHLTAVPPLGNTLPLGVFQLPSICLQTSEAPAQMLEIKWMQGDSIICRDTVSLFCEPDCGYILEERIGCDPSGGWNYSGLIKNTSAFVMDEAHIIFTAPSGMSSYNQTLALGGLLPNNTFPFSFPIGFPAVAGDTVCFTVAMHEIGHDDEHTNCCNFTHCIVIPECNPIVVESNNDLRLYPNPTPGRVEVAFEEAIEGAVQFHLLDSQQRIISSWQTKVQGDKPKLQLDLSPHPRGLYFVVIETKAKRWVQKVVLQ